ncbi:MAG: RAD55 family ATPase [Janthinobacterium lividum]
MDEAVRIPLGEFALKRMPLGIDSLDRLLQGGLPEGNSLLVQGAPGTGKTVLGMQFLEAGVRQFDQPGLMITFEEHPRRLYRDARALGWDFEALERDRKLLIVFTSPEAFLRELVSDQYGRLIKDYGFQRIVVDSLTQFESYPSSSEQARVRFERIINGLRRETFSVVMTRETESREAPFRVTPEEYLADTIVQLENRRMTDTRDGRRMRLLEVLKNRGSGHSPAVHQFVIGEGGLTIQTEASSQG